MTYRDSEYGKPSRASERAARRKHRKEGCFKTVATPIAYAIVGAVLLGLGRKRNADL